MTDPYYHRTEFRDRAAALGLECTFLNRRYGWARTNWPAGRVPEKYQSLVAYARLHMPVGADGEVDGPRYRSRMPSRVTIYCGCRTPRAATLRLDVLQLGAIRCDVCQQEFRRK
jgi:hypothetical protein